MADILNDILGRGPWSEDLCNAQRLQLGGIFLGDDPAAEDQDIISPLGPQQFDDTGKEVHMRSRQAAHTDHVHILLDRRLGNLLRSLTQASIDDLHTGIAQCQRQDLGASIVAVETRLRDQDSDGALSVCHTSHPSFLPRVRG